MPRQTAENGSIKALGQFFTPACVVDFACAALLRLKPGLDTRRTRAIDPACGDGAFVAGALRHGLASARNIVGIDLDPEMTDKWSDSDCDGPWMVVDDGLLPSEETARHVPDGSFDFVLGNPPFHGHGVRYSTPQALEELVRRYSLWRLGAQGKAQYRPPRPAEAVGSPSAATLRVAQTPRSLGEQGKLGLERLRLYPVEMLFLERFVRLARTGGLIAIVLPEGVLANARRGPERQWLFAEHTVHAVVGLPRSTFRPAGITAKTCLCFIEKSPPVAGHEVFLAEIDDTDGSLPDALQALSEMWAAGQVIASPGPWLPVPR
jgi:type I restriction enzyme M protein